MANLLGTVVLSKLVPTSDLDQYPTHEARWGKGSYRTVTSLVERDAISDERRELGMLVWVDSEKTLYRLTEGVTNADWENLGRGDGNVKRKVIFNNTDLVIIPDVQDYSIVEVWVSSDIYRPAVWNEVLFNQVAFDQNVSEGAVRYNTYTVQYDISQSELLIQLLDITSGVVVLY